MDVIARALASLFVRRNFAMAGVGFVSEGDRDTIAQAADFLVRREDIDTVVVYGVVGERFIEGWLSATLLFCVGPLTILGSLSDGLGRGIDQLALKAVLDGFAAMAFASTFGIGVLLSAVSIAVIQGSITLVGVLLGSVMPEPHIAALTATGGLLLAGIGLRLLRIKDVPVGDMLPALVVAPLLTHLVIALR